MKKNSNIKSILPALSLLLLLIFSTAQITAQEIPAIPDQLKLLYDFEGTWKGTATMKAGNDVSKGTVTHTWSKIAGGWGMLVDELADIPGMGNTYLGHNIFGYDIGEKQYHLYTVDNFADVHDHKGRMKDEKTMYLEHNGVQPDGKSYKEEITMNIPGGKEYSIDVNGIVDGTLAYTFRMELKKEK